MNESLSKLFINLTKRAEKIDREVLIDSFVDVGPLSTVLSTIDNQVLYGRRGTGKTHALMYLSGIVRENGDVSIYVDLRKVGSTGGLYADASVPIAERATRLLMDTLAAMHAELLAAVLDDNFNLNLAEVGPALDQLAEAITEVSVRGPVREELATEHEDKQSDSSESTLQLSSKSVDISGGGRSASETSQKEAYKITREGDVEHRVHFGHVGAALLKLT